MPAEIRTWTVEDLEQLIARGEEESLTLDYKAAASLDKSDQKRAEITKDVSAMANSAGGILFYGIKEFGDKERRHKPERIDPVTRTLCSKETLEHIINNIRPRLEGVVIQPVDLRDNPHSCVYVVTIPQSTTAHQAKDHRYYKRYNFESIPMEDHEVRDVMGRGKFPRIEVEIEIEASEDRGMASASVPRFDLFFAGHNTGQVFAKYVNIYWTLPEVLRYRDPYDRSSNPDSECTGSGDNTHQDVLGYKSSGNSSYPVYGPSRYAPILPGTSRSLTAVRLIADFPAKVRPEHVLRWRVYADNAPESEGQANLSELLVAREPEDD